MWKLPNGKTIRHPEQLRVGNVLYPKQIFNRWSTQELNNIGVYPVVDPGYDIKFYKEVSREEVLVDGVITIVYTTARRFNAAQLKKHFNIFIKDVLKANWYVAREEIKFLEMMDPGNVDDFLLWMAYVEDLRNAYTAIKADFLALTTYADAITYIQAGWQVHIPITPLQDEEG